MFTSPLLLLLILLTLHQAGRLGEKTGKGFYAFEGRKAAPAAADMAPILAEARATSPLKDAGALPPSKLGLAPSDVALFCFLPVVNEACRVLAEGIVDKASDADIASVLSMGFPPYRGGVLFWGDLIGAKTVVAKLRGWADALPAVRGFFEPCDYLLACAREGRPLEGGGAGGARAKL